MVIYLGRGKKKPKKKKKNQEKPNLRISVPKTSPQVKNAPDLNPRAITIS